MIVGTAGHIDHGKSTLVRALTGIDTDRLPEEKARGISIDLGYAYQPLPGGSMLGFVDVPGHERFVHTMLAGACGIDFALLVVAADDGVMPQTREHVAILNLLGLDLGAVAITKIDRVAAERAAAVAAAVAGLLEATALAAAPHFLLNAHDPADPGLAGLQRHLADAANRPAAPRRDGLFRLGVDRAFTLPGIGTIATGTAQAGEVRVGDTLMLEPAGRAVRVRGLHAQNRAAAIGRAGERLALNLAAIEAKELKRGDCLAVPRAVTVTERADARLTLLPGEAPLAQYAPVHLHHATRHVIAHVVSLDDSGWVQLVFDARLAIAPGERFVLRNAQATRTIGGGWFIDPLAPSRRRRSPARHARVSALERALRGAELLPLFAAAPWGLSRAELMQATARPVPAQLPAQVQSLEAGSAEEQRHLILADHWVRNRQRVVDALGEFHRECPSEAGPDAARLRRIAAPQAPPDLFGALLDELLAAGSIVRQGSWLQLPEHGAALSAREALAAEHLATLITAGGLDPPWARDLSKATGSDEARVRGLLSALGRTGRAYPVVKDLYFDSGAVAKLAAIVDGLADAHGCIEAASFRDATGLGRKRAIQILEFFDRVGYTRRVGAARVRRGTHRWTGAP